ncbi:hypothetical protein Psta_2107 [Pirellula staleyi DSM 6068]|uniref:Uncharacterized protein n=1 Tax=Pirellula staleyi (strain ATCC 27377 / DSM 6068 / ICPB 4128) TaxID=530564 RepID=D2R1R2_PIRSD|nr:hypothetical protein Psta_2107 [Pirellula staleyi DSM 6068]
MYTKLPVSNSQAASSVGTFDVSTTPKTTRKAPSSSWRLIQRILIGLGIVVFLGVVGIYVTLQFGTQSGIEFCPQTFEQRAYSQIKIPLIGIAVSQRHYSDVSSAFQAFVKTKTYLPFVPVNAKVWQVVHGQSGPFVTAHSDCEILLRYFTALDSNKQSVWEQWSEAHPELAKKFWPVVSKMAENDLYIQIPDIMDLAQDQATLGVKEFEAQLGSELARILLEEALLLQEYEDHAAAIQLLKEGLLYTPDNAAMKKALDVSQAAIGEQKTEATKKS